MSLRPRYSLLTLLQLTAAVAVATWYWFKPHRYTFDLAAEWNHADMHEPLEEELRLAAASSARIPDGTLIYDARRMFSGSLSLEAAKFKWEKSPFLASYIHPATQRPYSLLTSTDDPREEMQAEAERYGLQLKSSEKVICWVSSQLEYRDCLQIGLPTCRTGLRQVPIGPMQGSTTSYLLTQSGTIYQLNRDCEFYKLTKVVFQNVPESCRVLLQEELNSLE